MQNVLIRRQQGHCFSYVLSLFTQFSVTAGIAALIAIPVYRESGSRRFIERVYPTISKEVAGNVFLQLADTRHI